MTREEDARLARRLDRLCARWEAGEGRRRERDRRGMRIFRGEMWDARTGANTDLEITSNTPLGIMERVVAEVLRGSPEPEIHAKNEEDEDAARVAEGALRTNWNTTRVKELAANAYRLAAFTRQVGVYHFWRHELHHGIGDVDHRLIPGHRLIFDDRAIAVRDMEFAGFSDEMSRAKLITLFPDKAEEIESAAQGASSRPTNLETDPLKASNVGAGSGLVVDRLVAAGSQNVPPYSPVQSVRTPQSKGDPLSETVTVRFMWVDDTTPKRVQRPKLDPRSKSPMYDLARDETGKPQFEQSGFEVMDTPLGPQNVPLHAPRFEAVMEEAIVRKYPGWRHTAYVPADGIVLWDVAWDGPVPISIVRDRYPAWGFDASGSALRLASLASARNVLWTIIFRRLKKSLRGNWITAENSNLKLNKIDNEIGKIWSVKAGVGTLSDAVKEFPQDPLDAAYFGLLERVESEMELLVGVTPMMKGQAVGRADSPQTYEQVADQSGGPILDRAKLVDQWIADAAEIDLWFMQNYYTHQHTVEVETAEGFATWTEASVLALRGSFAVRVETGATLGRSTQRARQEATDGAQIGLYPLPMQARLGQYRNWRQGLKQRAAITRMGPQYAWLLGQAGAPPTTQATNSRAQQHRSHHRPGGK